MGKHKRNNGGQTEEKRPVSIDNNKFIDGRDIRNILSLGKPKKSLFASTYGELYFIKEQDFEVLEQFLESNTKMPALVISGEPDMRLFFKGIKGNSGESKDIFKYLHINGGEYRQYIFGAQKSQQTKNTVHYLLGNNPREIAESWMFRKEFGDISLKFSEYSVPTMPLLQGYVKIEGNEKNGKVKDIVTSVVNLGKNTELEAHIGDEIYLSKGFGDVWHNIRDYATTFNAGGKM